MVDFSQFALIPTFLAIVWPPWVTMLLVMFFIAICSIMVLTVLIQKPQGGGLASAFGGGVSSGQTAFGTKTGDALTVFTITVFVLYLLFAIVLNYAAAPQVAPAPPGGTVEAPLDSNPANGGGVTNPAGEIPSGINPDGVMPAGQPGATPLPVPAVNPAPISPADSVPPVIAPVIPPSVDPLATPPATTPLTTPAVTPPVTPPVTTPSADPGVIPVAPANPANPPSSPAQPGVTPANPVQPAPTQPR